jgi:hypothetical protein
MSEIKTPFDLEYWKAEAESENEWANYYFKLCQYFDTACSTHIKAMENKELTDDEKDELFSLYRGIINEIRAKI